MKTPANPNMVHVERARCMVEAINSVVRCPDPEARQAALNFMRKLGWEPIHRAIDLGHN